MPADADLPAIRRRIEESFARQGFTQMIGERPCGIAPAVVERTLRPDPDELQQYGQAPYGVAGAIADTAGCRAETTSTLAGRGVLTVAFKISLLAPTVGNILRARRRIGKSARPLALAQRDIFAVADGCVRQVSFLTAKLTGIKGCEGISD